MRIPITVLYWSFLNFADAILYPYICTNVVFFVKILFQMNFTILSHSEISHTFNVYSKPKVILHC